MRVTIRQKNIRITPALTKYIEDKIIRSVRRFIKNAGSDLLVLDLEFARTTSHHRKGKVFRAEAMLTVGRRALRAEAYEEDIRLACNLLREKLEHEMKIFKDKGAALAKREGRRVKGEFRYDPSARLYHRGRVRNEGS